MCLYGLGILWSPGRAIVVQLPPSCSPVVNITAARMISHAKEVPPTTFNPSRDLTRPHYDCAMHVVAEWFISH